MSLLQYTIVALFVSFGVELVDQYHHQAAIWLALLILIGVLITHTDAIDELGAIVLG